MSKIMGAIEIIRALISFWNQWKDYQRSQKINDAIEAEKRRAQAVEDSKKAETDEEIRDSQRRIVRDSNH